MTRKRQTLPGVLLVAFIFAACDSGGPTQPGATTLTLSATTATIGRNDSQQFTVAAQSGGSATQDVTALATWTSSNPGVATVTAGLVTVHALGTAQITVSHQQQSQTLQVTGRRRLSLDGSMAVRKEPPPGSGPRAGVVQIDVFVDGRLVAQSGSSNAVQGQQEVGTTLHTPPVDPGTHTLVVKGGLAPGAHDVVAYGAEAAGIAVIDRDTGDLLTTLSIEERRRSVESQTPVDVEFEWSLAVPSFLQ